MPVTAKLKEIASKAGQHLAQSGTIQVLPNRLQHDLFDFLSARTKELHDEYSRIQKRVLEDPGTAGDQGEENWATLLRNWLPPQLQVVTKGRIISHEGVASPQVDVLVLHPTYPLHLRDKKLYLAGGVVAAFECKITLTTNHIRQAIENSIAVKKLAMVSRGTPYRDLHSTIIYGLLSHSHSWKNPNSTPLSNIYETLFEQDLMLSQHPNQMLDCLCVADLGYWNSIRSIIIRETMGQEFDTSKYSKLYDGNGVCLSGFHSHNYEDPNQIEGFTPIGAMLAEIFVKIAWQNPDIRRIANYLRISHLSGSGKGVIRHWPLDILSPEVKTEIIAGGKLKVAHDSLWDEWTSHF